MLLKELKAFTQVSESESFTAQQNLDAVIAILQDKIPTDSESRNQADLILKERGHSLYYVSINPPHGDFEAYVVEDPNYKCSYYVSSGNDRGLIVKDNKMLANAPYLDDTIEEWISNSNVEGGPSHVVSGCIEEYITILADHEHY